MMNNLLYFSDYFELKQKDEELDFVNIPLRTDIEAYIDALIISKQKGVWFAETNNEIVDFFEKTISLIKKGNELGALRVLSRLGEPNETHLGLSSKQPDGCGIGKEQAFILYKKLKNSKAVLTGSLKDLSDCELLIPGIGSDKISDITTNIIRGKLMEYTEEQCNKLKIPVRPIRPMYCWSSKEGDWVKKTAMLPHYNNQPILLVPKCIVRQRTTSCYREYYNIAIIPYLQDWHLSMNTSLVKTLKNGKLVVPKNKLKEQNPCTKDFVLDFTNQHPEVLEKYKATRI